MLPPARRYAVHPFARQRLCRREPAQLQTSNVPACAGGAAMPSVIAAVARSERGPHGRNSPPLVGGGGGELVDVPPPVLGGDAVVAVVAAGAAGRAAPPAAARARRRLEAELLPGARALRSAAAALATRWLGGWASAWAAGGRRVSELWTRPVGGSGVRESPLRSRASGSASPLASHAARPRPGPGRVGSGNTPVATQYEPAAPPLRQSPTRAATAGPRPPPLDASCTLVIASGAL